MRSFSQAESSREPLDRRIARLAAQRYGVFSRSEADRFGATKSAVDWRLAIGRWERLSSGVYRLAGAAPSWRQALVAACLSWGENASASHRAAGAVFELPGFHPQILELIVPRGRWRRVRGVIVHRVPLPSIDRTVVAGIPVTTPARTLIDLAGVAPAQAVQEALDDALRRKLVSMARLRWRLEGLSQRGRPGISAMRSMLDAREPGISVPQSVLETRLLRLLDDAGLPPFLVQHEIRDRGRLVAVVDFAYPELKLAVEADGYRWHSGRARWEQDLARRNALTVLGWRVIHVTWGDIARDPERTVAAIRAAAEPVVVQPPTR